MVNEIDIELKVKEHQYLHARRTTVIIITVNIFPKGPIPRGDQVQWDWSPIYTHSSLSLGPKYVLTNGKGEVLAADKSCQILLEMLIGRPSICRRPQFNGKTNNIDRPTNSIGHANLLFLVITLSSAIFWLSSARFGEQAFKSVQSLLKK